jgi:ATP-dependent Lhr-like helicase
MDEPRVSGARFALTRATLTLAATLSGLTDVTQRASDDFIRLRNDLTGPMCQAVLAEAAERLCLPDVNERALASLKFTEALPEYLAAATLAVRLADLDNAAQVLTEPTRWAF